MAKSWGERGLPLAVHQYRIAVQPLAVQRRRSRVEPYYSLAASTVIQLSSTDLLQSLRFRKVGRVHKVAFWEFETKTVIGNAVDLFVERIEHGAQRIGRLGWKLWIQTTKERRPSVKLKVPSASLKHCSHEPRHPERSATPKRRPSIRTAKTWQRRTVRPCHFPQSPHRIHHPLTANLGEKEKLSAVVVTLPFSAFWTVVQWLLNLVTTAAPPSSTLLAQQTRQQRRGALMQETDVTKRIECSFFQTSRGLY